MHEKLGTKWRSKLNRPKKERTSLLVPGYLCELYCLAGCHWDFELSVSDYRAYVVDRGPKQITPVYPEGDSRDVNDP